VQNGKISGDISGTIDANGGSQDATANLVGLNCQGPLTFTLGGDGTATLAGNVLCTAGAVTVKGTLAGQRTGP
jgi:hypothetical protein